MLWKMGGIAVLLLAGVGGCTQEDELTAPGGPPQSAENTSTVVPLELRESQKITLRVVTPEQYQEVIESHRGKVVLVDFWATWCAVCIQRFPHTVEMSKTYADAGLVVISMAIDDPEQEDAALEILKGQNADFENLLASAGGSDESFETYKITSGALPHYKVYGRDGRVVKSFLMDGTGDSSFTPEDVEQAVKSALGEK